MKKQKALFLFQNQWDLLEKLFSLPVEEREAYIVKLWKEKKTKCLGTTDKTVPELAIECIKKGVKVRSYVSPVKRKK